jgi:hypothetical protein
MIASWLKRSKKHWLVFGRGVWIYRLFFKIVWGWCFLDKGRLFTTKAFFYKVWSKVFRVVESESMRGCLSHPRPIRFFGAWSSANQVLLVSHSRPIRFFEAGSSANQMLLLSHSRPIRFLEAGSSANQMLLLSHSRPIRFFEAGSSANQVISLSRSRPITILVPSTVGRVIWNRISLSFHGKG